MISSSRINLFVITILFHNVLVDIHKKELLGNEVCLSHLINRFHFQEVKFFFRMSIRILRKDTIIVNNESL